TAQRTIPRAPKTAFPPQQSQAIAARAPTAATRGAVQAAYGKLPLHFEANRGQSAAQVKFLARGSGYTVFLTATEAVLALSTEERMTNGRARPQRKDEFTPPRSAFSDPHSALSTETV